MRVIAGSLLLSTWVLAGCAIKPTPDDVTFFSTAALVGKVRCEAQSAMFDIVQASLRRDSGYSGASASRDNLARKDYHHLPPTAQKQLEHYDDAIIVLDFQLRMTEKNNLSGGTTLARPFTAGLDLLGLKVADNRERQNYRTFRVNTDIANLMRDDCAGYVGGPNYQYPIAGEIGIKETFSSYFELVQMNKLGALKDWTGDTPFVDTIKFTTEVSGEFDPSFSLKAAGRGYVFQDAGGIIGAGRKDEHQLIVGISFPILQPASAPKRKPRAARIRPSALPAQTVPGLSSFPSTRAIVNDAVNRSITKQQLFGINPLNPLGALNQ